MFILKRKHYYCSKKIQMSWLYCSISTASLAEEEGWPKTKDGKALLHGARDSFLLKIAFGSVSVCWWWLSSSGMLPARRCCSGVLQLFCCWTLPPGGSCTLLLSPGTRPPVCCRALLNSAPKDCLKPKLNAHKTKKTPNQPKRSHHHGTAVSYFPFWTRWAALWGEKEVLTAEFMRSSHPIVLSKTPKHSFTNDRWNYSLALCFQDSYCDTKVHFQGDELCFRGFLCWYFLPFQQSSQEMLHRVVDWVVGMPQTQHSFLSTPHAPGLAAFLITTLLYSDLEHSPELRPI